MLTLSFSYTSGSFCWIFQEAGVAEEGLGLFSFSCCAGGIELSVDLIDKRTGRDGQLVPIVPGRSVPPTGRSSTEVTNAGSVLVEVLGGRS